MRGGFLSKNLQKMPKDTVMETMGLFKCFGKCKNSIRLFDFLKIYVPIFVVKSCMNRTVKKWNGIFRETVPGLTTQLKSRVKGMTGTHNNVNTICMLHPHNTEPGTTPDLR